MTNETGFGKLARSGWKRSLTTLWDGFHGPVTRGLLLVDVLLILLHAAVGFLFFSGAVATYPEAIRIDRDWGFGETFNYAKWVLLAGAGTVLFWHRREPIYLGISVAAAIAVIDDSLQLHEYFGGSITQEMFSGEDLPKGLGEIAFIAFEGLLVAGALIYSWIRSSKTARRSVIPLLMLFGSAVFCAVVIDFIHAQAVGTTITAGVLGILEDGGEMIFLSLMVGYAAGLLRRPPSPEG